MWGREREEAYSGWREQNSHLIVGSSSVRLSDVSVCLARGTALPPIEVDITQNMKATNHTPWSGPNLPAGPLCCRQHNHDCHNELCRQPAALQVLLANRRRARTRPVATLQCFKTLPIQYLPFSTNLTIIQFFTLFFFLSISNTLVGF